MVSASSMQANARIDDDVQMGHFNVVTRVQKLTIKDHVRIGHLNIIRGGAELVWDVTARSCG